MQSHEYQDMFSSEDHLWWYAGLRLLLRDQLKSIASPKAEARLLDAGSGTGKNLAFVHSEGFPHTYGLDLSRLGLDFCRQRGLCGYVHQGNITHLPFEDASFDFVYCMDVLYMLNDQVRPMAVAELIRVLKPGGRLLAHNAALEGLRSLHDDVVMTQKRFTIREHDALFESPQLRKLKSSYRVSLLFPMVAGAKLLKRLAVKLLPRLPIQASDQGVPAAPLNAALSAVMRLENALNRYLRFPFGSSVYYIGEKKPDVF